MCCEVWEPLGIENGKCFHGFCTTTTMFIFETRRGTTNQHLYEHCALRGAWCHLRTSSSPASLILHYFQESGGVCRSKIESAITSLRQFDHHSTIDNSLREALFTARRRRWGHVSLCEDTSSTRPIYKDIKAQKGKVIHIWGLWRWSRPWKAKQRGVFQYQPFCSLESL